MILKEYFNFEKNIDNKLFAVSSFEKDSDSGNDIIPDNAFDSFYILFNVGSILPIQIDQQDFFCPAKDCLFGCKKIPQFKFNANSYYKYILVKTKDEFSRQILAKIRDAANYPFSEIFNESEGFCFSFSLNISIIEMIENIFRVCGENENKTSSFFYLELEANFITMTASILKIILFEEHKFNAVTASPDLKFYMIMRKTIIDGQPLDDMLDKYHLSRDNFIRCYRQYFPKSTGCFKE